MTDCTDEHRWSLYTSLGDGTGRHYRQCKDCRLIQTVRNPVWADQ